MDHEQSIVAFIFQSNPDRYQLREHLVPGKTVFWKAYQYRQKLRAGQLILLWEARGSQEPEVRGLYGWGITVGEIRGNNSHYEIPVTFIERWVHQSDRNLDDLGKSTRAPIAAADVLVLPSWKSHRLARMPIGTNFPVNTNQLKEIVESLIKSRLSDSQFSKAVATVLRSSDLDPTDFQCKKLIVQNSQGIPDYVSERLGEMVKPIIESRFSKSIGLRDFATKFARPEQISRAEKMQIEVPDLLSDSSAEEDKFDFKAKSDKIAGSISKTDHLTVAIYGKWGSGKTTFLKLIMKHLEEEYKWAVTWFDLWEHQNEPCVLTSLLDHIAAKVGISKTSKDIKDIALSCLACAKLTAPGFSLSGSEFVTALEKYRKKTKPVRVKLESCVNKWQQTKKRQGTAGKMAVFVDNIERCAEDKIARFLQEVNVIFDFDGVIFVLAAARKQLEQAIAPDTISGQEFMKKFIQAEFTVPKIEDNLLIKWIMGNYSILSADQAKLVLDVAQSNPRQIKRTLNNLSINLLTVSEPFNQDIDLLLASTLLFDRSRTVWQSVVDTNLPTNRKNPMAAYFDVPSAELRAIPNAADELDRQILESEGGRLLRDLTDSDMQRFVEFTQDTPMFALSEDPTL